MNMFNKFAGYKINTQKQLFLHTCNEQPKNEIKGENHIIILVNGKKAFDRLQHSYMAKILSKQGKFFDLIKNAYKK